MPIPPLLSTGLLPKGLHDATLAEVEAAFGASNARRIELFQKLKTFVDLARTFGIFRNIFLDGSFVTDKLLPGDIDAVLEMAREDLPKLLSHPNRLAMIDSKRVKMDHEIHLFFNLEMVDFFQHLRPEEAIMRKLDLDATRGILKVAL